MDVQRLFTLLLVSWIGFISCLGAPGNRTRAAGRIVGGVAADIVDFPHQVSLKYFGSHHCGGSIISDRYILTAAHCMIDRHPSNFRVVAGITLLNEAGSEVELSKVKIHWRYNAANLKNDIALIELATPLVFSNKIQSIALQRDCSELAIGDLLIGTGWGATVEDGPVSNSLQSVTLGKDRTPKCRRTYKPHGEKITRRMICASAPGKDTCQGDSGGPLIKKGLPTADPALHGVTSWGYGCADPAFSGVYTRVCKYKTWIYRRTGGAV